MKPLLFSAGRIFVMDSYCLQNRPATVANEVEPYRSRVPDGCEILLMRGRTLAAAIQDQSRDTGAMDMMAVCDNLSGTWLKPREKNQTTGDLLKEGIAWVTRTRKEREAIRNDPVALAERLWLPGGVPKVRQEPEPLKPWWRRWLGL